LPRSFGVVAALSLLLAPAIHLCVDEPPRRNGCAAAVAAAEWVGVRAQVRTICSRRTFVLLVCQGVVGNMPWVAFDSFGVLWLQHIGFSNASVAQMMVARRLGSGLGSAFGGWLSDRLFATSLGDAARVYCAQLSVLSGFPSIWVVLMAIPRSLDSFALYTVSIFVFGFGASWCTPACNRPIITEIVAPEVRCAGRLGPAPPALSFWLRFPLCTVCSSVLPRKITGERPPSPQTRGSIIGFWLGIETVFSALSAPVAAWLATDVFGYRASDRPVGEMAEAERLTNVDALAHALLWTMVLPWVPCFLCYTAMHWTYKEDKARYLDEAGATAAAAAARGGLAGALESELWPLGQQEQQQKQPTEGGLDEEGGLNEEGTPLLK
jgi:hypothetical protein